MLNTSVVFSLYVVYILYYDHAPKFSKMMYFQVKTENILKFYHVNSIENDVFSSKN